MTQLRRDRLTWLVYATVGVYGFFLYGFGISVPLLREDQGTSRAVSGLHSTALAVGAVVSGLAFAALVRRYGRGRVLATALAGLAVGVLLYTSGLDLPVTLLGAVVAGTAGSTVVNSSSPILTDHHGPAGPAAITEANAVGTAAGAFAPVLVGLAVGAAIGWRAGLLVTLVGVGSVLMLGRGTRIPPPLVTAGADGVPTRLPRAYWPCWVILVLCVSVEFCVTIWSSDLLRQRLGLSDGVAASTLTLVVLGMTLGRVGGARLTLRWSVDAVLLGGLGLAGVGFAMVWTATAVGVALAGMLVLGLGMGMHFPLAISRALASAGGLTDLAAARASIGAGVAVGTAPFLLGALADAFGTRTAFLLVPALLATAAVLVMANPQTVVTRLAPEPT